MPRHKVGVIGLKGLPATGGGARAGEAVIRRLAERYDFTVFATSAHASAPEPLPGVRQVIVPSLPARGLNLIFYYWASAVAALLKHDFDLVHVHHGMGGYVVPLLRTRCPTVVTFRGHTPGIAQDGRFGPAARLGLAWGERLALRFADELVTVAKPHVAYFESLTTKEVHWIPNGVDAVQPVAEGDDGGTPGEYIVFAAGRVIPVKGCHFLLQAMRSLQSPTRLLIIGDATIDQAYTAGLHELASGLDVHFVGLVRDQAELLRLVRRARLFVFPSVSEAMSNMLLEAVMCGAPLVCSDIPANRSVLREDEAVFFPSGSVRELADRLAWALEHPEDMRARSARARLRIQGDYDWDSIAESYDRLYQRLIARRDEASQKRGGADNETP